MLAYQLSLGTLFFGLTGLGLGLAIGRDDWSTVAWATASIWIAIGLLQQAKDVWVAGHRRSTDASVVWYWRYMIAWRVVIALLICGHWLLDRAENAELVRFVVEGGSYDLRNSVWPYRSGLFGLCLVIALSSAPWMQCRPRRHSFQEGLLDLLGAVAGSALAVTVFSCLPLIEVLVHIAIRGTELVQPYIISGHVIYDMDVGGDARRLRCFTAFSLGALALSVLNAGLVWRLARGVRAPLRRSGLAALLMMGLAGCGSFAYWVHHAGLYGISPFLAESQVIRPWFCWMFAAVLLAVFGAGAAHRLCYQEPKPSQPPVLVWHRGPGRYLNEDRLTLLVLSFAVALTFVDPLSWSWGSILQRPQDLLRDIVEDLYQVAGRDAEVLLYLAVLCLCLHGCLARKRFVGVEQKMTPVPTSPLAFVGVWAASVATTIGFVEAVTWSSFALWLV